MAGNAKDWKFRTVERETETATETDKNKDKKDSELKSSDSRIQSKACVT